MGALKKSSTKKSTTKKETTVEEPKFTGPDVPTISMEENRVVVKCPFCHATHVHSELGVNACDRDGREYNVVEHAK